MKNNFSNFLKFKISLVLIVVGLNCVCAGFFRDDIAVGVDNNSDNSQPRVFSSETSGTTVNNSNTRNHVNSSTFSSGERVGVSSSSSGSSSNQGGSSSSTVNNSTYSSSSGTSSSSSSQNTSKNTQQPTYKENQPKTNSKPAQVASEEPKNSSQNVAQNETTSEEKNKAESAEEKPKPPEDLPAVEDEEIAFPEVAAPASAEKETKPNYFAGVIAWGCILGGIAMVVFIMIKGKSAADVPVQRLSGSKKRRRRGKHLLPDNYYREKF